MCGETLVSRPKQGGVRAYQCAKGPGLSGCGRMSVKADPVEEFVVEAVLYRLDSPELAAAMSGQPGDPDEERWQTEIEQSRQQLDELAAMYGRREIGLTEWQAARTPIERRVTDAKSSLAGSPAPPRWPARSAQRQSYASVVELAANPAARDRRRRPRPPGRRPRQTRLQPLRPEPVHARLARLTPGRPAGRNPAPPGDAPSRPATSLRTPDR